jgi:hypothetical protein
MTTVATVALVYLAVSVLIGLVVARVMGGLR